MSLPERDGDGYLVDMNSWTPEIASEMAAADGVELDDEQWEQINKAREYFEEYSVVPPIRKFFEIHQCQPERDVQKMDDGPYEANHQVRWLTQTNGLCIKNF